MDQHATSRPLLPALLRPASPKHGPATPTGLALGQRPQVGDVHHPRVLPAVHQAKLQRAPLLQPHILHLQDHLGRQPPLAQADHLLGQVLPARLVEEEGQAGHVLARLHGVEGQRAHLGGRLAVGRPHGRPAGPRRRRRRVQPLGVGDDPPRGRRVDLRDQVDEGLPVRGAVGVRAPQAEPPGHRTARGEFPQVGRVLLVRRQRVHQPGPRGGEQVPAGQQGHGAVGRRGLPQPAGEQLAQGRLA
mmetsp:Transcript_19156/g.26352  ORF Transcript_19156/g.26352 Transcript_19156/m.26352 type:complete len:245 (-) Transcript_19156:588-1322(-)